MLAHVLRRALRSLWENLSLNLVATGVITAALMLGGVYLSVMVNLDAIVERWDRDVHISAYFFPDVSVDRRFAVKDELSMMRGVDQVHYVSEADARRFLEERVSDIGPVLDELGDDVLPASLEITLRPGYTGPAEIAAFAEQIQGPDFEDIEYGQEWVQRFNTFLGLLQVLGVVMGSLIFVAAVFLVGNTMHLVAYARRAELETMKLVGATWGFVAAPFLIEGALQGLIASALAIGGVYAVHELIVVRLQGALQLALGDNTLRFLPVTWQIGLAVAGLVLGLVGCWTAIRRFWSAAP
ncbi:MAG: ABC transporter permease [Alphaproteobacteria bacterium]|nr:ABC transporter permease [Alphaproteobacteria bacterium]